KYQELSQEIITSHLLIINTTPLGMFPNVNDCPDIPYEFITSKHLLYDLTYNPEETLFLKKGKEKGARIKNGLEMLHLQAEEAWKIWNR
ncbi:MAG TPA: shikimate dehydrogenase, partial [Bacteroidia bacterium]